MKTFRTILFWVHLVAGIVSGLSIGIMCFTGTALAFEKELVAWSERDARRVTPPAPDAPRLSLDELQKRLREAQSEARPMSIVVQNDPHAAVAFATGRTGGFYANPYTGEIRQPQSGTMGEFMHVMTDWHRFLGFHGEESRPRGKLVNGICNIAFCVLAITGLYLWMPRSWSWRAVRPVIWFRQNSTGKARDFNWHNAIGFWTAPILIVLTLTAIPISFQWGGRLINQLTGTPPPAPGAGPGGPGGAFGGPAIDIPAPAPGTRPMSQDALFAIARKEAPNWETITLRTGAPAGRGGRPGAGAGNREGRPPEGVPASAPASAAASAALAGEASGGRRGGGGGEGTRAPQAVTLTIRESNSWPRTANTTLSLHPYTGEVLRRTGYADLPAAQQVRSWTRFLHTGEALGNAGQFFAGLACLGGCFLVYTGFALSWRRFFGGKKPGKSATPAPAEAVSSTTG